ncbi:phosphopantetheine-binding protein [Mycobacterium sp.]|uniref:phosphopantetheine-binding protein n=1 Tax=Mycobacterium sp. TaxID=1785 RepID=UPI003F9C7098
MPASEEVSRVVTAVVARILQISPEEVARVRRGEHEAWNSLKQIEIVLQVEEEFEVQFEEDDIAALSDVKSIVAAVDRVRGH